MSGDEKKLNTFIQDFRKEFMQLSPEEIAFPRSVNGLTQFSDSSSIFTKGTPIHTKGALMYNYLVKREKLTSKFPLIQEGDKIKFIYLRQPNPTQSNVISFITKLKLLMLILMLIMINNLRRHLLNLSILSLNR